MLKNTKRFLRQWTRRTQHLVILNIYDYLFSLKVVAASGETVAK